MSFTVKTLRGDWCISISMHLLLPWVSLIYFPVFLWKDGAENENEKKEKSKSSDDKNSSKDSVQEGSVSQQQSTSKPQTSKCFKNNCHIFLEDCEGAVCSDSTHLPLMQTGFMWVKFVVGSRPCPDNFLWHLWISSLLKNQHF